MALSVARMVASDGRVHAFREICFMPSKRIARDLFPLCLADVREVRELDAHDVDLCARCESAASSLMQTEGAPPP